MREREGQGYVQHPHEHTVEQEGDARLAAGAQNEIRAVHDGVGPHEAGVQADEPGGQAVYGVRGVVQQGDAVGERQEREADQQADGGGEGHELAAVILCGFDAVSYTHIDVYKRQGWS